MKLALLYNRNQRIALGERCQIILKQYPKLEISQFNLNEIRKEDKFFDLYLRLDDGDYSIDIPAGLHPCAWWISDTHLSKPFKKIKNNIGQYDYIFCMQKEGTERLQRTISKPIHWIPWATDELPTCKFLEEKEKIWDIAFIGTSGKYTLRKVMLENIKENFKNIFIGTCHFTDLCKYYSKARIVVNYPINNDINARIFEAMGAGALVLTKEIKNNGFEELFSENIHLSVFSNIEVDLTEKINYYLNNKTERIEIAKTGYAIIHKEHTFRHRLERIFTLMGYNLNSFL